MSRINAKDDGLRQGDAGRIADLLGVVLCGGESRRMGRDKGLLTTDGVPWAIRMEEKLKPWSLPVVFSINRGQYESYSAHLPGRTLIVDRLGIPGPMNGLMTVHAAYPSSDLLLLACDLQDMDEPTLSALIKSYVKDREKCAAAYAYQDAEGLQPLCTIYTTELLRLPYQRAEAGELTDVRLRSLLKGEGIRVFSTVSDRAFKNYNRL